MLALALFVGLGPVVEAACPEERGPEPDGGCSFALCCSCCAHVRVDSHVALVAPSLPAAKATLGSALKGAPLPEPREVLHVPKPARS